MILLIIFIVFFYIFAVSMSKYFATPKTHKLDLESYFGQHKEYNIFLLKSNTVPIRMAAKLSDLFPIPFVFLDKTSIPMGEKVCEFPLFLSMLSYQNEANIILMPNKATIPAADLADTSDPLLGYSLFDEDAYVFNRHGRFIFPCEHQDYDYLLLLYGNKGYELCKRVMEILEGNTQIKMQDVSYLLQPKANKKAERERVAFLQRLFIDLDIMVTGFLEELVRRQLRNVTNIPKENHALPRFGDITVSLQPLLEVPLMWRPDF